ncbi:hypothetical protein KIPB_013189 [Kipferlia bialata]|uniref:Uncharacterized protein n=1 Tax=Kipferlia bialata TaxID=797122 RepID=A0A9K3D7L9_9EUKA|nr:hypothetical protein KIPB_013189 [Kipferlia bialata]|eukprot:g13189.t1
MAGDVVAGGGSVDARERQQIERQQEREQKREESLTLLPVYRAAVNECQKQKIERFTCRMPVALEDRVRTMDDWACTLFQRRQNDFLTRLAGTCLSLSAHSLYRPDPQRPLSLEH